MAIAMYIAMSLQQKISSVMGIKSLSARVHVWCLEDQEQWIFSEEC